VLDRVDRLQLGLGAGPAGGGVADRVRAAWREGGPRLLARRLAGRLAPRR
jgi:hypothetical protein